MNATSFMLGGFAGMLLFGFLGPWWASLGLVMASLLIESTEKQPADKGSAARQD